MDYQELIRLATKGNKQALEDLFALGDRQNAEKNYEQASNTFRESAISYRISASRNSSLECKAKAKAYWLSEENKLIKKWITKKQSDPVQTQRIVEGLNSEVIFKIVGEEIWPNSNADGEYYVLITLLESELSKLDNQDIPANSPLRRVLHLMQDYYSLGESTLQRYLDYQEIRIYADLLADEIEKKFQTFKA